MNRERLKGIIIGIVLTLTTGAAMTWANAQSFMREIHYGVRINLHGQELQLDADSQPFIMEGRTFLPVRAISEALDLPVDFDPATNTVYLGNRLAGQRQTLRTAAPFFDRSTNDNFQNSHIRFSNYNYMGGSRFENTLVFTIPHDQVMRVPDTRFTLHNLNRQFISLSGMIGRVDGSFMVDATVNFIGDGVMLRSIRLNAGDMPIPVNIFIEGIQQLRIEVLLAPGMGSGQAVSYGMALYLE